VLAGWSRLHDAHALVLWPDRKQVRMLNPFSAVPTAHRVRAGKRWWYGNCAWDAFGICAALGVKGHIESLLPRLRRGARLRKRPARRAVLPLPGSGGALVERYRLHLKRHESLPVGRAHRTLAGRARTGTDACRGEAARARAGMVERPTRPAWRPHSREQNQKILDGLG